MHNFYFTNQCGIRSTEYNIFLEGYPAIKYGQEIMESVKIPGKGTLWRRTGTYSDTEITFVADVNTVQSKERRIVACMEAKGYLLGCKSITFCDAGDLYFRVKSVEIGAVAQYSDAAGDFDVKMICDAGVYLRNGCFAYGVEDASINNFDECCPVYIITGEGKCKLQVNGNTMEAQVAGTLKIDTWRKIAYRADGELMNTEVAGDYEKLYLRPGHNDIKIQDGYNLEVIPNWRILQ